MEQVFKRDFDMNLIRVNAQDRFLSKLKGVSDPEKETEDHWGRIHPGL